MEKIVQEAILTYFWKASVDLKAHTLSFSENIRSNFKAIFENMKSFSVDVFDFLTFSFDRIRKRKNQLDLPKTLELETDKLNEIIERSNRFLKRYFKSKERRFEIISEIYVSLTLISVASLRNAAALKNILEEFRKVDLEHKLSKKILDTNVTCFYETGDLGIYYAYPKDLETVLDKLLGFFPKTALECSVARRLAKILKEFKKNKLLVSKVDKVTAHLLEAAGKE